MEKENEIQNEFAPLNLPQEIQKKHHPNWGGARVGAGKKKKRDYVMTGFYLSPVTKSSLNKLSKDLKVSGSIIVDTILSEVLKIKSKTIFVVCPKCENIIAFVPDFDPAAPKQNYQCSFCGHAFAIELCADKSYYYKE